MNSLRHRVCGWSIAMAACVLAAPVQAQQTVIAGQPAADVSVRNFRPSPSAFSLFATEAASTPPHLQVAGGLLLNLASEPLRLTTEALGDQTLVQSQLTGDLLMALGLFDWLEISADLPILLVNNAQVFSEDLSGTALGDLSLGAKAMVADPLRSPLGLSFYGRLLTPTGTQNAFATSDVFAVQSGLIVERKLTPNLGATLNLGAHLQKETAVANPAVGTRGLYAAGVHYDLANGSIVLGGELVGEAGFEPSTNPLEALVGVKFRSPSGLQAEIGGGTGVVPGIGSPEYRVFAGVRFVVGGDRSRAIEETMDDMFSSIPYTPVQEDWDRLGNEALQPLRELASGQMGRQTLTDRRRAISSLAYYPTNANKKLLFELLVDQSIDVLTRRKVMLSLAVGWGSQRQSDGTCAQRRQDGDVLPALGGFLNHQHVQERESAVHAVRQTRTRPGRVLLEQRRQVETSVYLQQEMDRALSTMNFASNGCVDRDKDGLDDVQDQCPSTVEDRDGFQDGDGCPELDNDLDGIEDTLDKCPDAAGVQHRQGCVDEDDDKDGLTDRDQCPDEAEDFDGFQDDDGCPDPDNDKDGIPDARDECPDLPEVINGQLDDDGCPDDGVALVTKDLAITQKVFFKRGSAVIRKRSFTLLDGVAQVLAGHTDLELVEVQGHTDDVGRDKTNLQLSAARAAAVREYLVKAGIAPERLVAKGYGSSSPEVATEGLTGRKLKSARDRNRRVRFVILKRRP